MCRVQCIEIGTVLGLRGDCSRGADGKQSTVRPLCPGGGQATLVLKWVASSIILAKPEGSLIGKWRDGAAALRTA
jgi:hypothetical protein